MATKNNPRNQNRKSRAFELLGSGKADAARTLLASLSRTHTNDAEILFALGVAEGMLGNFAAAENSLRKAASLVPDQANVHYNLGKALKAQNKVEQATKSFTTACQLEHGNAAFHNDLSNVLTTLGRHRDALVHIQQAASLSPGVSSYHYNLGNTLIHLGLNDQAVDAYRQAIALQPDFRIAHIALGDALLGMGQLDEALAIYEPILQAAPRDAGALIGKVAVLNKRGQFNEARELLEPVLATGKIDAFTAATFAGFSHHIGREDEAVRLAEQALDDPQLRASERARLCFALGTLHDRNCRFEEAFHHFAEGNALRHSDFNRDTHREYVDQVIEAYSPAFLSQAERARNTSDIPVFIVGMPRSGTSLVEQILASHPQVHGAGELDLLANIADSIPERTGKTGSYSQAVHALTADMMNELTDTYLDKLTAHNPAAHRITDKLPSNFMQLGLIDLLFPSARVIHCKRNPLDTCLSCFFQDFSGNQPYAGNLTSLGEYYLEYERIMAHWQSLLRIPVHEIQYEDLVANAGSVTPELVRFCGLEWDDACLDFHKTKRTVATASYDQVRRPLYTSSVARWRHYEEYIGELIKVLGVQSSQEDLIT